VSGGEPVPRDEANIVDSRGLSLDELKPPNMITVRPNEGKKGYCGSK
jgi:hypothetical protein